MEEKELTGSAWLSEKLRNYWSKFDSFVFCSSFILTLLVHLYMFTHKFLNHDDVHGLYSDCAFGLSSGRWFLQTVCGWTGDFSSAWLNGVVGALFLALAVVFLVRLFRIRHHLSAVLLAVCMAAFPALASTYSYMFCAPQYLFALALAVIGAYLIRKETWLSNIAGVIALAFSMGCYQSYICFAVMLLVVCVILDLLESRYENDWKRPFFTGLKYCGALAAGVVLYFLILKYQLWKTGTVLSDYHGMSSMGQLTPSVLLTRIGNAYNGFFAFFTNESLLFPENFPTLILIMVIGLTLVAVGCIVKQRIYRHPLTLILLLLLIGIFPLASSLMFIMADAEFVHTVMYYPMVGLLLLPILALDRIPVGHGQNAAGVWFGRGKILLVAVLFVMQLLLSHQCILVTNQAYFCMDMTYENAYAYFVKLTTKIEMMEDYESAKPVALIGYATQDTYVPDMELTGVLAGNAALNMYSRDRFLTYFLGEYYPAVSDAVRDELQQTQEFAEMPVYPQDGSIREINGVIVVKVSNVS